MILTSGIVAGEPIERYGPLFLCLAIERTQAQPTHKRAPVTPITGTFFIAIVFIQNHPCGVD
jgi:hypothetical protein